MEIIIHIESKKIHSDFKAAIDEYIKRCSPYCKITLKQYKNMDKVTFKPNSKLFLVTPGSNSTTSPGLADLIRQLNLGGISCIEFVIMNSDSNYSASPSKPAQDYSADLFNLSSFSMSTGLTTVVLTEQLYRAYTILNNITYHK